MMKVVINGCFGGFGLSHAACMRYAELAGFKLYPFVSPTTEDGRLDFHLYVPWNGQGKPWLIHYSKQPLGPDGKYAEDSYWSDREIARDDPILVCVVEEMGEASFGHCAQLRVIEIPDGVDWEIDEYDGNEHVAEKHRTWA